MVTMSWMVVRVASDVFLIWRHKGWLKCHIYCHGVTMTAYSSSHSLKTSLAIPWHTKFRCFLTKRTSLKIHPAPEHDSQPKAINLHALRGARGEQCLPETFSRPLLRFISITALSLSTGVLLPELINVSTLPSVPHHLLRKMFSQCECCGPWLCPVYDDMRWQRMWQTNGRAKEFVTALYKFKRQETINKELAVYRCERHCHPQIHALALMLYDMMVIYIKRHN